MKTFIKQNWFKLLIGFGVVLLSIVSFLYLQIVRQQQDKINKIVAQEKCAQEAKTFFDYFVTDPQFKQSAELSNHYNRKFDKCFVLIKTYNQVNTAGFLSVGSNNDLYDAVERKVYGSYSWMSEQNKKYWDVPPLWCDMYPDGNKSNHQTCKSEEEFYKFVDAHMND